MNISFHGAAKEVTGSCYLVEAKDAAGKAHKLLIDCGMFQGERMCGSKNLLPFKFGAGHIEAVFVTHPHADHTGRLPKLIKDGFTGKIYMTPPCRALTRIVLEDAFHIMSDNAEECGDPVLYSKEDLDLLIAHTEGVGYHEEVKLAEGLTIMFHDAGHVLGSAYISIMAEGKTVVFSGDIGNDNVPILPPTEAISHADVIVCESTYGHRRHESHTERRTKLKEAIEQTIRDKGVLMIPAFSIERTQELLYEMNAILKDVQTNIPIFLDSPMAIRATEIYRQFKNYLLFDSPILAEGDRDFFSFPNLKETLHRDESMVINKTHAPMVIIAGSGMMSGGRIMHHLIRYLPDPHSTLLIIGYQAVGTVGRKLYEGAHNVEIFGKHIPVKCRIRAIGSFSAHGDMDKLTRWLHPEDGKVPAKIFVVHGDEDAQTVFATHLRHELRTEVIVPEFESSHEV